MIMNLIAYSVNEGLNYLISLYESSIRWLPTLLHGNKGFKCLSSVLH